MVLLLFLCACSGHESADELLPRIDTHSLKTDVLLSYTPVKDQGNMKTCWIYAYLACLETERIEQYGDSLNLSPLWLERALLTQQAMEYYFSQATGAISMRGVGPEAELLINKYGMVPYTNYNTTETLNSNVLERSIANSVGIAVRARNGIDTLPSVIDEILPSLPHSIDRGFYLYSVRYTPRQFSQSLVSGVSFRWITSYTHHPYGETFALEVPDNRQHHEFLNLPLDSLYSLTVSALRSHHPVYWEGGLSDFSRDTETRITPSLIARRQKAYSQFRVTDDHAMAIIGMAHDAHGTEYLICKNSWGRGVGNDGLYYMPKSQFLMNTIFIGIPSGN